VYYIKHIPLVQVKVFFDRMWRLEVNIFMAEGNWLDSLVTNANKTLKDETVAKNRSGKPTLGETIHQSGELDNTPALRSNLPKHEPRSEQMDAAIKR
jgi:hypothetical protein